MYWGSGANLSRETARYHNVLSIKIAKMPFKYDKKHIYRGV